MDLHKIPNDIIINHIIPFTYRIQPKKLLRDIISFYRDYEIVLNYYPFEYNDYILSSDLIHFTHNNILFSDTDGIVSLFKRLFFYNIKNKNNLYNNLITNPLKVSRILFGLFTPNERKRFLHKYIIPLID